MNEDIIDSDPYEENVERAKFLHKLANKEGDLEAPIDLNISTMSIIYLNPLTWYNHDIVPKKLKLTNTGYTVILSAKWFIERPYLIDGPFLGKYVFSQLHFHWGENETIGSEHCFDGNRSPMELHAVHFKADYHNQDEAMRHADGIAILVYLFRLQNSSNPALRELVNAIPRILEFGSSTRLTNWCRPLVEILRPFGSDYFVYWGSLNGQTILWIVSREPIAVAQEQVSQFRALHDAKGKPLLNNCRELRERQDRSVFHVNPSGRSIATLLSVPITPPPLTANQVAKLVENYEEPGIQ